MQFRINSFLVVLLAVAVLVGTAGVAQADLVAHWALDEGASATTAIDSTGNHNGTIDTTSGYGPTINQTGMLGKCYLFNGDSGNHAAEEGGVKVPYSSELEAPTHLTLSQWFLVTKETVSGMRWIISTSGGANPPGKSYVSWLNTPTGAKIGAEFGGPANSNRLWAETSYTGYLDGNWHQLTITYSMEGINEAADLYLDGAWSHQVTQTDGNGIYANGRGVMLGTGSRAVDAVFDGYLDDLGIWNETLTHGEANSLYTVVNDLGLAYNLSDMEKLFKVFDNNAPATIGGIAWERDNDLPAPPVGSELGAAWSAGGNYYVWLDNGSYQGVKAVVPEPSTLLLLATGLLGLLAYAWRKRK